MSIAPSPTSGDDPWKAHLAAMTPAEKFELWQRIWEDLASTGEPATSPEWHRAVVESRLKSLDDGTAEIEDWDDVERQFDEQGR